MTWRRAKALPPKMKSYPLSKAGTTTAISHYRKMPEPTPFGTLFLIPPEIRLRIYGELVNAGSVRFLASSKAIHSEALDTVSQDGVCRLEFNIFKPHTIFPVHDPTSPILNLEIRLNLVIVTPMDFQRANPCNRVFNNWLSQFTGCAYTPLGFQPPAHPVPRKSCKILLDCFGGVGEFERLSKHTFDVIRYLTGFETLVLAFANEYRAETTQRMIERRWLPRPDPRRDMASAMHGGQDSITQYVYSRASQVLEATLGPAEYVWDREGVHLEFHPRAHNADKIEGS